MSRRRHVGARETAYGAATSPGARGARATCAARTVALSRRALLAAALGAALLITAPPAQGAPTAAQDLPGVPAPPRVKEEIQRVLALAIRRFEAKDTAGVLEHVSDQYRTSPLTKPLLRDQLNALFQLYDAVRARVRVDEVRMVGEHAWVYSTGDVSGRLAILGGWMTLFSWGRELEVARLEGGRWRLYGYQQ